MLITIKRQAELEGRHSQTGVWERDMVSAPYRVVVAVATGAVACEVTKLTVLVIDIY